MSQFRAPVTISNNSAASRIALPAQDEDIATLRRVLVAKLTYAVGKDPIIASDRDWFVATALAVRDRIVDRWMPSRRAMHVQGGKRVYYLSQEYLIGRLLFDSLNNLGLTDLMRAALGELGVDLDRLRSIEPDAALGNGGLGRLAACFMESMATLSIAAYGYGIRYDHGLFRQVIKDGWQQEYPEEWLSFGNPWEFERPEVDYTVGFGGTVEAITEADDATRHVWHPAETVQALAYDTPIVGWRGRHVNTLRLWSARALDPLRLDAFNSGDHVGAHADRVWAESISKVLYPSDAMPAGRELRLRQEYFFASASLQDLVHRHLAQHGDISTLSEKAAIQLNDTHPAIAVAELMRILVDKHGVPWTKAWAITTGAISYTNHTLLPEALESWAVPLMARLLPRHMQIIYLINGMHLDSLRAAGTDDAALLSAVSLIDEQDGRRVTRLLVDAAGERVLDDAMALETIAPFADDAAFRDHFATVRRANKSALAALIADRLHIKVDPDALFDVQIKRIHEYKRQLLNILETIALYNAIRAQPTRNWAPRVKIFAGKAAANYQQAKLIIKLVNDVATVVNSDPTVRGLLKVVFLPNYNVSLAEAIIPAADLSEQISTAGMEASGTGNMKLALNGALTIGTLDGANVEIRERVGTDNIFIFGLSADEVTERRRSGIDARATIAASPNLAEVLDTIASGVFSSGEGDRFRGLLDALTNHDDFMVTADFDAYYDKQREVVTLWHDRAAWWRASILNTAGVGWFSSDRTVREYAEEIWNVPVGSA